MLRPAIAALFLSVAIFSTAHAKDTAFSAVVSCEKYEGSFLTKVNVERSVADIGTPQARFVDRLTSEVRMIDPGSAMPWVGGLITQTDVTRESTTYKGSGFALNVKLDYSTWKQTDNYGAYTIEGQGVLTTPNDKGQDEKTELNCIQYDHM